MSLYTSAELKTKIEALDAQIAETEKRQISVSGGAAQGMHTQRGDLAAMYRERKRLEDLYAAAETREQSSGVAQGVQYRRAE